VKRFLRHSHRNFEAASFVFTFQTGGEAAEDLKMLSRAQERRVKLSGTFDSLGLASLIGAPVAQTAGCGQEAALLPLPHWSTGKPGLHGNYELTMTAVTGRSRLTVTSFEMAYTDGSHPAQVATFLDLAVPVGLEQQRVLGMGASTAHAVLTPLEAVGTEPVAAPPVGISMELGSLSGAVAVTWPDGDETSLQRYADHSLAFWMQVDGERYLDVMVLPGGYDVDLEWRKPALPEPGVMALLGCTLGAIALFSRREC
jgi:hypothetical protein